MMTFSPVKAIFLICVPVSLLACKTGFNRTPDSSDPDTEVSCDQSISNSNADATTLAIFNNLARLSCGNDAGLIMGQSLGSGNQLVSEDQDVSYDALINDLKLQPNNDENPRGAGGTAALISLDYEFDRLYTEAEIDEAHTQIQTHWEDEGLVSISWTPLNPWVNDGTDANNLGDAEDTSHNTDVDLAELLDNNSDIGIIWNQRLAFISDQLIKLQNLNITVLWRPFPEMNSEKYWYGAANISDDDNTDTDNTDEVRDQIRNLWIDMYNLFEDLDLDNLIWVYSPAEGDFMADTQPLNWAFPYGDAEEETDTDRYVDIVAPVVLDDSLLIDDYDVLLDLDRPLAAARLSTEEINSDGVFENGSFDNEAYTAIVESRPAIAYWVSWHNYTVDGTQNIFSLVDNENTQALVENDDIITLEKLDDRNFRTTNTSDTSN